MNFLTLNLLQLMARDGVVHRDQVKNLSQALQSFLKKKLACKVYKKGRVFYELTPKALAFLESRRKVLLEEAKTLAQLHPKSDVYSALLGDLRFLDEKHPHAQSFRFLNDWQLQLPVVPSQLELAKYRYYAERGFA